MRYAFRLIVRLILLIGVPGVAIYLGAQYYVENARFVTTENAYVKANLVAVSAGVSGHVTRMLVSGNQRVTAGQLLFSIDDEPFRIELTRANAAQAQVRNTVLGSRAAYFEAQADLEEAEEQVAYNQRLFERQKKLAKKGISAGSKYDEAENDLALAKRRVRALRERLRGTLADLGGDINLKIENHPMFVEAQAVREAAERNFRNTLVYSPTDGIVGRLNLQQGEYVDAGRPLFPIVQTTNLWVEANLKETQLTHINLGQNVTVIADAYPDHTWTASVRSFSPSTGAEVAILPPQNASGNWVKVVQRIPVKIEIDQSQHAVELRPGMTVAVSIDTEREVTLIDLVDSAFAWTKPGKPVVIKTHSMTVAGEARPSVEINRPMILATITLSTMVVVLDMSITVIALPHMQGGLSATADQVAWVMTSYIVTMSIMIAYTGWLASRIGRRRLYIAATVMFTVGALLSGSADSLTELVIYRAIQGAAAAPAFPLGQAIILDAFPRERHGQALAYWGVGIMVAPVTGPIIGGYITELFDWRWVFFLGAPLGVMSVLLASKYLVDVGEDRHRKFDWLGFMALAAVLGAAQLMMDRGQRVGWFESTEIVIEAGIIALGLYVLIVHMLTSRNPYLPPALFTDRNYLLGLVFSFVLGTFVLSGNYVLTLFLQNVQGYPVMSAGVILTPRAIGTLVALFVVGRLIMHLDARILIATGFAATSISSLMLAQINADVGVLQFSIAAFLNGFGTGCIWAPMMTLMFSTLHRQYRTEGSMLVNLTRSYGSGLGISIAAVVLTRSQSVAYSELTEYITPYREALQLPDAASQWSLETAAGLAALQTEVSQQAFMFGVLNNFLWAFVAAGLALPLVALFRRNAQAAE